MQMLVKPHNDDNVEGQQLQHHGDNHDDHDLLDAGVDLEDLDSDFVAIAVAASECALPRGRR